jgi:putative oxidoreductase
MIDLIAKWKKLTPYLQSVLRIAAAFTFMLHGTMKLFAFPAGMPPSGGTVRLISQLGLAGILEAFGGALLLLGLFTRPVAFLLAGEMAVAYFQVHFPMGFWPTLTGGELALVYCFLWLYISAAGAGPWSIDAIRRK